MAFLSITILVLKVLPRGRDGGMAAKYRNVRGSDTKSFLLSLANICRRDEEAAARLFGETKQFNFGKISYPHLLAAVNCVLNSNAHARGKKKKKKKRQKSPLVLYDPHPRTVSRMVDLRRLGLIFHLF